MFNQNGDGLYGRVDQIPGVFHVTTRFVQFLFVPLWPYRSYLIVHGQKHGKAPRAYPIRFSGKSVGLVYGRFFLVLFTAWAVFLAMDHLSRLLGNQRIDFDLTAILMYIGMAMLGAASIWLTNSISFASYERAMELAREIRFPEVWIDLLLGPDPPKDLPIDLWDWDKPVPVWNE